jgi:uncharacterized LabA/DUF88 family protein
MSLRDSTVRVIQPGQRRLKIFVDFWNLIINARKQTKFKIDFHWDKLAEGLVGETRLGYGDESLGNLAGCYIFGSYSKSDARQYAFVNETLDKYGSLPGLFFDFRERIRKETSIKCSSCGEQVSQSSEAGVDVLLTVEMIKHAAMREHDYLALVSSDRDFVPLLSYLKDQGQRVLHVSTGAAHRQMRSVTWAQIELGDEYSNLCSIEIDRRLILTSPLSENLQEAKSILDRHHLGYDVIDITKVDDISDEDLAFLLRNQRMFFHKLDGDFGRSYSALHFSKSMRDFRRLVSEGQIYGNLPYVIHKGRMEAYFDGKRGWIRNGNSESEMWAPTNHS